MKFRHLSAFLFECCVNIQYRLCEAFASDICGETVHLDSHQLAHAIRARVGTWYRGNKYPAPPSTKVTFEHSTYILED